MKFGIYGVYYRMFESPSLNLACLVLGVTCLLPDFLDKLYRNSTDTELKQWRWIEKQVCVGEGYWDDRYIDRSIEREGRWAGN